MDWLLILKGAATIWLGLLPVAWIGAWEWYLNITFTVWTIGLILFGLMNILVGLGCPILCTVPPPM